MPPIKQFFPKTMLAQRGHTSYEEVNLRANLERYKVVLSDLTTAQFLTPVAPDKWTPAEVADHLYRANQFYPEVVARLRRGNPLLVLPLGKLTEEGRMVTEAALPNGDGKALPQALEPLTVSVENLIVAAQRAEQLDLGGVCLPGGFFGPLMGESVSS